MIRLIEDIEIQELLQDNHPEVLRRYWVFSAYSGPAYNFPRNFNLTMDEEDAYIKDFLFNDSNFINIGKYDKASKILSMDEWTSLVGFVSTSKEAKSIAEYITKHDFEPELITKQYPNIELIGYYWIDGWWELYGDINLGYNILNGEPIFVDSPNSSFLSKNSNEDVYFEARQKLENSIKLNLANKLQ